MPRCFPEFRDGSTDGLREIAILEQLVCHKSPDPSADAPRAPSAAELVDDPQDQTDQHADDQAGDQREIESPVLAALDDVPGQAAEAKGEFASEVQERADDDQNRAQQK
jgi:hypothetical protein